MGDTKNKTRSSGKKRPHYTKRRKQDKELVAPTPNEPRDPSPTPLSSSGKKLKAVDYGIAESQTTELGNSIVNLNLLIPFFSNFLCPEPQCMHNITVSVERLGGLAQRLMASCASLVCDYRSEQDLSEILHLSQSETTSTTDDLQDGADEAAAPADESTAATNTTGKGE